LVEQIRAERDATDVTFNNAFAGYAASGVSHLPSDRHLAFAVPLDVARRPRLPALVLRGGGREVSFALGSAVNPRASVDADGTGAFTVRWDVRRARAVLVRDARTGRTLAIARGGRTRARRSARDVELMASDGVTNFRRRVSAR
jgi:hypothetical protein